MTEGLDTPRRIVVALGGNAIVRADERGTIEQQFVHAEEAMAGIAALAAQGHVLVVTHGNGPVVGNIVIRGEAARDVVPPMPLYIADADSEGGVGLMLQQALHNELLRVGVDRQVATIVTQTIVEPDDPAFAKPSKPIGPYVSEHDAHTRSAEEGWVFREFPGRGWRRVVASPLPVSIVEAPTVASLAEHGTIVIAAGGGGVPVIEAPDGSLAGVDAVVDKDWAGAVLACALDADLYVIAMESDAVYLDWGTPAQRKLTRLSAAEARRLLDSSAFESGTVGPKVAAAAYAVENCGCEAVICSTEALSRIAGGLEGTRITRS